MDHWFRRLQLLSAAMYSLGHGSNDARKTMASSPACCSQPGICRPSTSAVGHPPAHAAIGLGTLPGGWRTSTTMGSKITKLQPFGGLRRGDVRVDHAWILTLPAAAIFAALTYKLLTLFGLQ